jgi:hypothetical protein
MKLYYAVGSRLSAIHARRGTVLAVLAAAFMMLISPAAAMAAPAPNDDFDNATPVGALPFTDRVDTREATAAADDPTTCSNNGSVWYRFTPGADMVIEAKTAGSDYYTVLSAYTGSRSALTQRACVYGPDSRAVVNVTANTTYYFLVAVCCGNGGTGGGDLVFSVAEIEPPGNDDFANATTVPALPFSDTVDTAAATRQVGESNSSCGWLESGGTVWYAFTPTQTASIMASVSYYGMRAVYTGSSLANLREVACGPWYEHTTFRAVAGETYYFQVSVIYGGNDPVRFDLDPAPAPVANFGFGPSDPSTYDTVQFYDWSYDPADVGIASQEWQFGDGATATGQSPAHRYAAEGDYTVRLTVTTTDGRSASTTRAVQVRTHDVAIVRLSAPESASVGQTRQISVDIRNTRHPETVTVELLKSVPGGFQHVGSLTQSVPVRLSGRTTSFTFNYTFTDEDAAMGKVTFKAIATLEGARDALPADNEAIASPTKVNRM